LGPLIIYPLLRINKQRESVPGANYNDPAVNRDEAINK
jgi:hypothetical protein